jgi:hypothetical protein
VYDVSRFTRAAPEPEAVFTADPPFADPPVALLFYWSRYQPGAFTVNLPADLPAIFGARFADGSAAERFPAARFGLEADAAEHYPDVVTEPETDANFMVKRIQEKSTLATASTVGRAPIGWVAERIPFEQPRTRNLQGGADAASGRPAQAARLYLQEPEASNVIQLTARLPGAWGNDIAVSVRPAGPARFDVGIACPGARFEQGRQIAMGPPLQTLIQNSLQPGPIGVLQAKAAGVEAGITRDQTFPDE